MRYDREIEKEKKRLGIKDEFDNKELNLIDREIEKEKT